MRRSPICSGPAGSAKIWIGQHAVDDLCDPMFKIFAARKRKDELELIQAQNRARELRGAAWGPAR